MAALSVSLQQRAPIPLAVQFDCEPGELVALVGPSGSGKTTILRSIAGLVHPQAGRIEAAGITWLDTERGVRLAPQARRVGLVFQSYALFPHLSALRNVALVTGERGAAPRARELIARVHLAGLEERRPAALSGGQQQRVALARALARDPAVLLLDEPFSAVDQATRQTLYRELAELRRMLSLPIVLVTHDLLEARMLADRMVILDRGETLQQGTPGHILSRPRNARVAKLLGIQNHFEGLFESAAPGATWGTLHWGAERGGLTLRVIDKGRIDNGARVSWVIAGEHLQLRASEAGTLRPDAHSAEPRQADEWVDCVLEDALALGEITRCKVRTVTAPRDQLIVNVPTNTLREAALHPGDPVQVRIEPHGVHIMPARSASKARAAGRDSDT